MTLLAGSRLGPYEIVALLGSGGMGEVYRAKDTRLGREVAVKVLPVSFAKDEDRLRRFELEAKTTSALNHPNILSVFDFGMHESAPYLVTELLEGETLRARMNAGPLPARKALELGAQIALGLAAAHEKGIIHRDLKPENLFILRDGRIKILDFGLAKLTQLEAQPGDSQGNTPTMPVHTEPGAILGSVGYMPPEQVRGQPVDHRGDLFSFGAILFEMISGKRAFKKETAAETMSAILREEPAEISSTRTGVNPAIERIIHHCLEKNPAERFQSARDLAFQLEAVGGSDTATGVFAAPAISRSGRRRLLWAGALAVTALLAVLALLKPSGAPPRPLALSVLPPEQAEFRFTLGTATSLQLSPDGRQLLFTAAESGGEPRLWLRELSSLKARPLPGTEAASFPFWSPDSRAIAFFQDKKLKKMDFDGGPPVTICEATTSRGGSWGPGGVILFTPGYQSVIYRVSDAGGKPEEVTKFDEARHETTHRWPFFLPDGKHFLFFAGRYGSGVDSEANSIQVGSLDRTPPKFLLNSPAGAQLSGSELLFFRQGALMAQPLDLKRYELAGGPRRVADSIDFTLSYYYARFSASRTGLIAYQAAAPHGSQPAWYDLSGKKTGEVGRVGAYMETRLSADGNRWIAAFVDPDNGSRKLWLFPGAGGTGNRFTNDDAQLDLGPIFSPDGATVVYSSFRNKRFDLYEKSLTGESKPLYESGDTHKFPTDWSPDGKYIAFQQRQLSGDKAESHEDIWILPLTGDKKPYPFIATPAAETGARFSPDGRWLAWQSEESGRPEVYVTSFPAHQGKWQISNGGGSLPSWRRDGKALYYSDPAGQMVVAELHIAGEAVTAGPARPLFAVPPPVQVASYEVAPSGDRVLIIPEDTGNRSPVTLLVDWQSSEEKK